MPTTQMMPKMAPNVTRAMRVENAPQPNRDPSNPRHGIPTARESRPAVTTSPLFRPQPVARSSGSGFSIEKAFVWLGFVVALALVALFGVDLACAWPFHRYMPIAEAVFAGCGAVLGYLSWDAYRDLR